MGVIEKLKRLHKQSLLKPSDIGRVVVADEAGVNVEEYLNRARTLESYLYSDDVPPVISDEISSPIPANELFTFPINITAGTYAGTNVYLKITMSPYDGCYLQYYDDDSSGYVSISGTSGVFIYGDEGSGFELQDMQLTMRAKVETAGAYEITFALVAVDGGNVLIEKTTTITVSEDEA